MSERVLLRKGGRSLRGDMLADGRSRHHHRGSYLAIVGIVDAGLGVGDLD